MDKDIAERLLPLEGGVNFRDMGGYETVDGRRVKWRHLYRSGAMHRLTEADRAHLDERGIRTVIDLRSRAEQQESPNDWGLSLGPGYWSRPHDLVFGNMHSMARDGIGTVRDAEEIMESGFRMLPEQQAEAYAELFRRLAEGGAPLAFHCTAGKDRTGGGAALILSLLGVPRETIIADFTMTERAVDLQKVLMRKKPNPRYAHYAKLDPEIRRAFSAARPSYIAAFLDTIAQRWENAGNYLKELGISSEAQQDIRALLLD
ncbi:MAG: tyrosine-protein phosphatase [Sphingomonadaceae bacterium]